MKEEIFSKQTKVTLDNLFDRMQQGEVKEIKIIVKADVQGSVEAVKQSLEKFEAHSLALFTVQLLQVNDHGMGSEHVLMLAL